MLRACRVVDATDRLGWLAGRLLADLGADVVKVEPRGVDVAEVEWRALNVGKRLEIVSAPAQLERLAASADIFLCTPYSENAYAHLPLSARTVVVAITPFGMRGPKARWLATDLELMAAGGAMSLAGEPDGTPMRVSAPQAYAWAGAQAAVGALIALFARAQTGRGQLVDVSAQAAVIIALSHAPAFVDIAGITPIRAGAFITGRSVKGAKFRVFWPCRDGYLNFILYGGAAGRRTNEQLVDWMRGAGFDLGAIDWQRWDPTRVTQAEVDAIEAPMARFFATLTKQQFLEEAHRREMLGYPVATVADIAADPQLEARGFWQEVRGERHCGAFVIVDGLRPPVADHLEEAVA